MILANDVSSRLRFLLLSAALALPALSSATALTTEAERSGFARTGRYAETIALCDAFQRTYPDAVRCETFGTTPEGRPMKLLVVSRSGALDPAAARARGVPVVQFQGGIHAGEIDGKDAGFLALRELLDGSAAKGVLDDVVVLFVPVFNVDGHERFGPWHRPNQRGPEQMGWRTTAQNFNLNRDYAKADTPEMHAMLELAKRWDPILTVDLHATNGAQFEHDVSIQIEPLHAGDAALRASGRALRDRVMADLAEQGSLPLPFYPSFVKYDDPTSGITDGVAPPRFSTGYYWLRNRFAILVETHSWKTYPVRVKVTRNMIVATLQHAARDGRTWLAQAKAADAAARHLGGTSVPLTFKASDTARTIDFRGYAYTRTPSEISGALMTRYDETTPQIWKLAVRDDVMSDLSVPAPRGGYVVPVADAAWMAGKLALHGIVFSRLDAALPRTPLQTFRAAKASFGATPVEGHQTVVLEGTWGNETRDVAAGALFVPIAQDKARLVMALLEPQAADSFAAWGWFNQAFERKEYMEPYVAEAVAREQLATDPSLGEAFAQRLDSDPAFAADPAARLDFFYRRAPSFDERLNLYPVMRTDAVLR